MCAGTSCRMGSQHKLLMNINGVPVIRTTAREVKLAQFNEVIAVTGYKFQKMEEELGEFNFETVRNMDYKKGLHSSIKIGFKRVHSDMDFVAICLADQPLLTAKNYNDLLEQIAKYPDKKLFQPIFDGKKGNPAIISTAFLPEILAHVDEDRGLYYLFDQHPDLVQKIEMSDDAILIDIDTPELFSHAKNRLETRGQ